MYLIFIIIANVFIIVPSCGSLGCYISSSNTTTSNSSFLNCYVKIAFDYGCSYWMGTNWKTYKMQPSSFIFILSNSAVHDLCPVPTLSANAGSSVSFT